MFIDPHSLSLSGGTQNECTRFLRSRGFYTRRTKIGVWCLMSSKCVRLPAMHIINKLKYSSRVFTHQKPIYHQKVPLIVFGNEFSIRAYVYSDYCVCVIFMSRHFFTRIYWGRHSLPTKLIVSASNGPLFQILTLAASKQCSNQKSFGI